MSIVGHEYTHAISNRMIGGPDEGITSEQGGAMGESWGDLAAAEYMFSHGYSNGGNPWAVGPYATGNKTVGIRDYAINNNPLNYGDYGFDSTGPEVHADGEIWNGTSGRSARRWSTKYEREVPVRRQGAAAALRPGRPPTSTPAARPGQCPGNRRWIQLMFDSFLLQQGATTMLDARDAMLAADRMRFGGANAAVMWKAFARRGMGKGASTPNADSGDADAELRLAAGQRNVTVEVRRPAARPARSTSGTTRPGPPRSPTPTGRRSSSNAVKLTPGHLPDALRLAADRLQAVHRHGEGPAGASARSRVAGQPTRTSPRPASGAKVLGSSAGTLNPAS